ncbi:MAG: transcription termination/antitermination protein NusA, partial [Nitrospiraceae bacterium]
REPGDRTKIAVASRDKAVDPVGACVGIKGSRVQAVVRELRGEKIDIIAWTPDPRVFIAEALNPATIDKVGIDEGKKSALVVVADSQLSLAIGRNGQNVRLAAKLTGWKIDIISATEYEKEKVERDKEIKAALVEEAEAQREQEQAARAQREASESQGTEESLPASAQSEGPVGADHDDGSGSVESLGEPQPGASAGV